MGHLRARTLPQVRFSCLAKRPTLLAWGSSSFTGDYLGGTLDEWTSPRPRRDPPALHERPDAVPVVRPALGDTDSLRPRLRPGPWRALPPHLPVRLLVAGARARGAATRSGA